jgi:hypothetical protein
MVVLSNDYLACNHFWYYMEPFFEVYIKNPNKCPFLIAKVLCRTIQGLIDILFC